MTKQNVTWFQVNNIIPIIVTVVGMTLTYGLLLTRLSVLETKMDLVLANQERVTATLIQQEAADKAMEIRLTAIETRNTFK